MANVSQNKPMKEFTYALVGIVLFLGVVLLIGISAFLRPAGEHVAADTTSSAVVSDEVAAN